MRGTHLACAAGLLAGAIIGGRPEIGAAQAAPVVVTTGQEWTDAFTDQTVASIALGADIGISCAQTASRGGVDAAVEVDGRGHTLTGECTDPGSFTLATSGPLDIHDITVVGRDEAEQAAIQTGRDARVHDLHVVVRNTNAGGIALGRGGRVSDVTIELLAGQGIGINGDQDPGIVERTTITGEGNGITVVGGDTSPDADPVVLRDLDVAVSGVGLRLDHATLVDRSALRAGIAPVFVPGRGVVVRSSTVVLDPDLVASGALGAVVLPEQGSPVATLEQSTVLVLPGHPDPVPPAISITVRGHLTVHASVIATEGDACQIDGGITSGDDSVATDDTCVVVGRVLADPGLEAYDPDLGYAAPRAGGPLVDAVETCGAETDQLGRPRPSGAACDIGAIELQVPGPPQTSVPVTTTPGTTATPATPATPVVGPARFTG